MAYLGRGNYPRNDYLQSILGPMEHQQFARESVARNPYLAISLGLAAPIYSAGKYLGLTNARSPASLDELFAAYKGIGQGLNDYMQSR